MQPLEPAGGVALGRGLRAHVLTGGYNIFHPDFAVPPPLELHMPVDMSLDDELLTALYETSMRAQPGSRESAVQTAVRWVVKSWMNSASVSWYDRLVFLKIASEAQCATHWSADAAKLFVWLFANATNQEGDGSGTNELVWQPNEPTFPTTRKNGTVDTLSAFEHWYMAFADARNDIVHSGTTASLDYLEPGSPYEGSFVEVGDRVMREAIKVELGELRYPVVWRRHTSLARASYTFLTMQQGSSAGDADASI